MGRLIHLDDDVAAEGMGLLAECIPIPGDPAAAACLSKQRPNAESLVPPNRRALHLADLLGTFDELVLPLCRGGIDFRAFLNRLHDASEVRVRRTEGYHANLFGQRRDGFETEEIGYLCNPPHKA